MKILQLAGLLAAALVSAVLADAFWLGAFAPVKVEERTVGPYWVVYREMMGHDPRELGAITDDLHAMLDRAAIEGTHPFDIYDVASTEVGFALPNPPTPAFEASLDAQTKFREIPAQTAMTVRFPWRHPLSFVVGFFRIPPAFKAYRDAHGYAETAIYTLNDGRSTLYIEPIVRPAAAT